MIPTKGGKTMSGAENIFDESKIRTPYADAAEHLEDCSLLLEFVLERSIDHLQNASGCIYRPGIMMGEKDISALYDIPLRSRRISAFDPALAKELKAAFDHIRSREKATKQPLLPLARLKEEFSLTLFEELAILLPLGLSLNVNVRNLYAYIANNAALTHPTTGVLYTIYQMIDDSCSLRLVDELMDRQGKMSVFIFRAPDSSSFASTLLDMPLILRDDVLRFVLTGDSTIGMIPYSAGFPKTDVQPEFFRDMTASDINSEGPVYVAAADPDDVPQFVACSSENGIVVLDGDLLLAEVLKVRSIYPGSVTAYALGPLFFRIRLSGEKLCVRLIQPVEGLCELFFRILTRFLPGLTVFVYGADKLPIAFLSPRFGITSIRLPLPDVEQREVIWRHFLKEEGLSVSEDINIADLADCYEISFSKIRVAVQETAKKARWNRREVIENSELKEQLRHMGETGLMDLAVYIPPVYSMEDLEIDETQKDVLISACNRFRIRNRVEKKYGIKRSGAYGNGVSVLIGGPPGTGKTMAAQVISKELSLPLYRVDLSQIISKYIGETQKNLNEIFEQAKKTNVILFFDEADALFAKRTEVNDSNDKYSNAETAFLLQKVEGHSGMTILATNLMSNFDLAFMRRITYVVRLGKPDEQTRLALWKSILPDGVKLSKDIDFEFFARNFDLSGSEIKAVLYNAMYMAAVEDRPLGNGDLVRSIRIRSEKHGTMNDLAEFGPYAGYLM